jgi:hypothetical protein
VNVRTCLSALLQMGKNTRYRIWNAAVAEAHLPFRYTPYQVRHTSWLID